MPRWKRRHVPEGAPVVFFHVMKCGGTSVRDALARGIAGRRHGPDVFEFDRSAAATALGEVPDESFTAKTARISAFRDDLLPYVLLTLQPRVAMGHFRYRDRYEGLMEHANFVTVLRDPVERLVSLYRYRRYKDDVLLPTQLSLDEVVATGEWAPYGHLYVETFAGRDDLDPRSDEAVAAAVATLRRFSVTGLTADLDDFASKVSAQVGGQVAMPRLNASPAPRDAADDVDPSVLEQLRAMCAPDLRVYAAVRSVVA